MLEKTSECGCQSTFTFQYLFLKKPSGCQLIGETRNNWDTRTDWLLAETRTNQLMVFAIPIIIKAAIQKYQSFFGLCEVYATLIIIKDCNTKKSIILWGLWCLCNSHHHQRLQYKKINHSLGFVRLVHNSHHQRLQYKKISYSLGVYEVYAKEGRKVPLTTLSVPFSRHKSGAFFVDSGFVIISTTIPRLMGACYSRKQ